MIWLNCSKLFLMYWMLGMFGGRTTGQICAGTGPADPCEYSVVRDRISIEDFRTCLLLLQCNSWEVSEVVSHSYTKGPYCTNLGVFENLEPKVMWCSIIDHLFVSSGQAGDECDLDPLISDCSNGGVTTFVCTVTPTGTLCGCPEGTNAELDPIPNVVECPDSKFA